MLGDRPLRWPCDPGTTSANPWVTVDTASSPPGGSGCGERLRRGAASLMGKSEGGWSWGQTRARGCRKPGRVGVWEYERRLTLFNVNVSCLLPTVVSDTLSVPFSASSFSRSSRVLLQEV